MRERWYRGRALTFLKTMQIVRQILNIIHHGACKPQSIRTIHWRRGRIWRDIRLRIFWRRETPDKIASLLLWARFSKGIVISLGSSTLMAKTCVSSFWTSNVRNFTTRKIWRAKTSNLFALFSKFKVYIISLSVDYQKEAKLTDRTRKKTSDNLVKYRTTTKI